ncbi:hypothetical protein A2U01_0117671 [Trifolium medium]|uniref:Uncharacterized protein n=1 Tax=Trifolium medium TaxID=97028 RepID=A0A392WB44_9FABA|nr:hypothetical protein [Trifolium medium]
MCRFLPPARRAGADGALRRCDKKGLVFALSTARRTGVDGESRQIRVR